MYESRRDSALEIVWARSRATLLKVWNDSGRLAQPDKLITKNNDNKELRTFEISFSY